jgi:phage anti-repressor protein
MDLVTFLKTHTKISNIFIEDFFGMYDANFVNTFSINLEKVAKWFNTKKGKLKDTLLYSYKEDIDYKIIKEPNNGKVGKPKETILLTPKCFKLIAMQTKSKKGVQVREYYYELEQVVDQYKEYIIQGLKEKIKKLENNQKPKINQRKGIIYIIETDDGIGHYKIGKTINLRDRLEKYNGSKKDDIVPRYIYETDNVDEVEMCIKSYAKKYKYRKYKEVYKADLDMLKELVNDCGDFNKNIMLKMKNRSKIQKGGNANYYIAIYKD